MAVTYGFFNSVNGDRKYNADTMSEFYTGICSQGVFQSVDNGLAVSAGTGLTVNVATGRAIIQGHWVKNDAALTLSIDAASATYARIDAVVIRYSASNRNIQIVVKTGTPAASPSAPSMTRAGGVYELCLAYVNVAANATSVTVTDKRSNTSVCGWAAVAQSIDGTYEAMIDDIKTGFDGVTYNSPGAAVRACDTKLANFDKGIIRTYYGLDTTGATDIEYSVALLFRSFYIEGDVDLTDYKLTAVLLNSSGFSHAVHFRAPNNGFIDMVYNSETGENVGNCPGGKVVAIVDWANYVQGLNISYSDAHIIPSEDGVLTALHNHDIEEEQIEDHDDFFLKATKPIKGTAKTASDTIEQRYLDNTGKVYADGQANIVLYAVEKGKRYVIDGIAYMYTFTIVAFTTDPTLNQYVPLKINGNPNATDFYHVSFVYQAKADGYLAIVEKTASTQAGYKLSVYDYSYKCDVKYGIMEDNLKSSLIPIKSNTVLPSIALEGRFINESNNLGTIGNTGFRIKSYPVDEGQTVVLNGTARIEAAYPIAVFASQNQYYGTSVIIGDDTAITMTDYNVSFTAPSAGFINVAYSTVNVGRGEVICYDPIFTSDGSVPKLEVKLDAFGDSITDNSNNTWSGHTTWLNHIENVTERYFDLTLLNGAWGGAKLTNNNAVSVVNRICGGNGATSVLDTTSDVVMVWAGTNDWADGATDIGTMDSNDTTIKGAVKKIIEYVSTNTTAALVFATPMQRYNDTDAQRDTNEDGEPINAKGYSLKDICDAIQEVCDFYGIDCIRMDKMAGFNRINIRSYAGDGLHPGTATANRRIASIFGEEFRRFLMN